MSMREKTTDVVEEIKTHKGRHVRHKLASRFRDLDTDDQHKMAPAPA